LGKWAGGDPWCGAWRASLFSVAPRPPRASVVGGPCACALWGGLKASRLFNLTPIHPSSPYTRASPRLTKRIWIALASALAHSTSPSLHRVRLETQIAPPRSSTSKVAAGGHSGLVMHVPVFTSKIHACAGQETTGALQASNGRSPPSPVTPRSSMSPSESVSAA
jgi:hypothetical protein